jgi:hypothetical protein
MSTSEDVFHLYERNSLIYYDCKKQNKLDTCPDKSFGVCFCKYNCPIIPYNIGNENRKCSLSKKIYIAVGEECPICLENICSKQTAYLTHCGHSFHKKCLHDSYISYLLEYGEDDNENLPCPLCRKTINIDDFTNNIRYCSKRGSIDEIENFWITKQLSVPYICYSEGDCDKNHYLGMNKNCKKCKRYVKKGILSIT